MLLSAADAVPRVDLRSVAACALRPHRPYCSAIEEDQRRVVEFVRSNTVAEEYVYVGTQRHDKVWVNDALSYFLLRRPIPVRWHELHPGVVTEADVQQEIIAGLERHRVQWVVLVDMGESTEPNDSRFSSGVHLLDRYIDSAFAVVFSVGQYRVLKRRV